MLHVKNSKCIRRLGLRSLLANRARNTVALLAIALTTVLFTSLFTIVLSISDGFQQANFRMAGGFAHASLKYLTEAQFEQLKDDPLIREWGLRRFVGMAEGTPFLKSHVEIGYSDAKQAHLMFCDPVEGRLPEEGTMEAATDTKVLELLGVEPKLGEQFTISFSVDGQPVTQTFTLCGWWEYDEAVVANHVLLPLSRAEAIYAETGLVPGEASDGMTGSWNLDLMFRNSLHIAQDVEELLAKHGYQNVSRAEGDNYISTGVNWGYTAAQLSDSLDPFTALSILAVLLLILFTGYLIIYNVFQISVANDIRFYGLLKTIGATPRQLRRIIRQQALFLSLIGIPLGLAGGWLAGGALTPAVVSRLSGIVNNVSASPLIFLASALFALFTVVLSCRRPGNIASRVSPVEAIRYTEGGQSKRKTRKSGGSVSLRSMATANLGRSRGKTAVTIFSLSLAVVLLNLTVTFTHGFDMDKYLSKHVVSDFLFASADYFSSSLNRLFNADFALSTEVMEELSAQAAITEGGRIYGKTSSIQEFVTEDYYRASKGQWYSTEMLDELLSQMPRTEQGLLPESAQLFGMEPFALDRLQVLDGDLSGLYEPGSRSIAAVYTDDDYGTPYMDSHWAKVGDTVTLRYVDEYEYFNPNTGDLYGSWEDIPDPDSDPWEERIVRYRDIDYTVAALVLVPHSLSYRYYGNDEFVLNADTFVRDSGTDSVMLYAFNTDEASVASMEDFLTDYTENVHPEYDFESKSSYEAEFNGLRSMFLLLGGALSFIVFLIGILNFFNTVLTGIITRRREFAMLQSVGMTGRQLKCMLICEGLCYSLGSGLLSLILSAALTPLAGSALESTFWFFTYRFTVTPILILLPLFALLGTLVPLAVYHSAAKSTIVERLRKTEG